MSRNRANFLSYVFILAAVAVAGWLYPELPDPMPVHWSSGGEADGYMAKTFGAVILPATAVLIFVLMRLVPAISPRGWRTDGFADVVHLFQVVLVGFASMAAILVSLQASGVQAGLSRLIPAGAGLLFMVLGSYLGRLRRKFFLGIRTPWTLASDEVWARTHRLGGWVFILIGAMLFAGAFVPLAPGLLLTLVLAAALIPVVYSYFMYRRVEGFSRGRNGRD